MATPPGSFPASLPQVNTAAQGYYNLSAAASTNYWWMPYTWMHPTTSAYPDRSAEPFYSQVDKHPPSLGVVWKLTEGVLSPLIKTTDKDMKIGPNIESWGNHFSLIYKGFILLSVYATTQQAGFPENYSPF